MKINLFTIVGGVVLLGAGYLALKHFGYLGAAPVQYQYNGGNPGYTDAYQSEQVKYSLNYNANVLPYNENDRINGPFTMAPSNTFHLSTIRPPG